MEADTAEVVYEDENVLVLFKPAGMTVQGNQGSTLEQWAAAATGAAGLQFVSDPECWRQREQKGVSGLVLGLKNQTPPQATDDHVRLQIQRKYSAVVAGPVAQGALSCELLCTCPHTLLCKDARQEREGAGRSFTAPRSHCGLRSHNVEGVRLR